MGAYLIFPDALHNEPALMRAADRLMYAVKEAGKNALEIEEVRAQVLEDT
jgi:GGDEF domain-containing protein